MQITQIEYNQCLYLTTGAQAVMGVGNWFSGHYLQDDILDAVKLNHKKIIEVHGWKTG